MGNKKEINWYLDKINSSFQFCNEECKSCSGPSNEECLSCFEDKCLYNGHCQNHCPSDYSSELINTVYENITIINEQNTSNISKSDIKLIIFTKVINETNFISVVFSSDNMNPEDQIKNGISAFDLGNCTEIIKEYYNISKYESLIILNVETK